MDQKSLEASNKPKALITVAFQSMELIGKLSLFLNDHSEKWKANQYLKMYLQAIIHDCRL